MFVIPPLFCCRLQLEKAMVSLEKGQKELILTGNNFSPIAKENNVSFVLFIQWIGVRRILTKKHLRWICFVGSRHLIQRWFRPQNLDSFCRLKISPRANRCKWCIFFLFLCSFVSCVYASQTKRVSISISIFSLSLCLNEQYHTNFLGGFSTLFVVLEWRSLFPWVEYLLLTLLSLNSFPKSLPNRLMM